MDGKAQPLGRTKSQKTCLGKHKDILRGKKGCRHKDFSDKKRDIPDRWFIGPDFLFSSSFTAILNLQGNQRRAQDLNFNSIGPLT
jgi:hypothetical protein